MLMVFKALHKGGVAAGLEEKERFRVVVVLAHSWQHSGLWQTGKGG